MSSETRAEWWSIEVFHGDRLPASRWKDEYEDALTVAAVTSGALYWDWHEFSYGVIFEVCFASEEQWAEFRALPAVRGALDSVPDPDGLLIYRGRGGASGGRFPRKPKPAPGAASVELEEPRKRRRVRLRTRSSAEDFRELSEALGAETPGTDPRQDPQEADTPQSRAKG
ncbi:MAG TPA: hypothetical protein VK817_05965 [Trebonia sp.]|jgi:hypothetical protein|nr:hypothetical protein [Trebonia sp.]